MVMSPTEEWHAQKSTDCRCSSVRAMSRQEHFQIRPQDTDPFLEPIF